MTGVSYPSNLGFTAVPIDPNLERDDWATLAHTKPSAFLTTLLSALAAPNPVSSAGPTVEEAFKSHLVSLAPNPAQMQPIPSLYSILKTFWLPSSPAYFSLTASASTARTPSEHRFLYWDPQPLVFNGIPCPSCSSPLTNKGRISTGPVKIYDIEKPFFVIACEYVCKSSPCVSATSPEGRKFASTDSSILRSLPVRLKDEFPAILMYSDTDAGSDPNIWNWKALGVSSSLWNLVRACLKAGLQKEAILQLVDAVQHGFVEQGEEAESQKEGQGEGQDGLGTGVGVEEENDTHDDSADPPPSGGGGTVQPTPQNAPVDLQNNNFIEAYTANTASASLAGANSATPDPTSHQQSQAPPTPAGGSGQGQTFDFAKTYYPYTYNGFFQTSVPAGASSAVTPSASTAESLKRPYPFGAEDAAVAATTAATGDSSTQGESSKRSPRHCCKCGSQECKGKGGRSFCTNPCQDCGKLDCKGRNSRRPDKKCTEGWL